MKTITEILESKNRCTINENDSDENENYYFKWNDVVDAMNEYLNEYKESRKPKFNVWGNPIDSGIDFTKNAGQRDV